MNIFKFDYITNKGNIKSLTIVLSYRLANYFALKGKFLRTLGLPVRIMHRFFIEWILGVEIQEKTQIGRGLKVYHGQGLVVHENTIIGNNVILRHNTTIGTKDSSAQAPVIGDNVNIGANSVILGDIKLGNNVVVGAGSVVLHSFEDHCIIAGNPAKIIKNLNNSNTDEEKNTKK